ncbi:protein takeout-like [Macrosteles quadrilineatus]|uniref:protein takeout-like n=1 Tax=Macrosteles quadrilineatus TaxID=74068 RepID=UPI0023E12B88|nr:protein takeout-like [Macrosteles quadrilineatus]XP_054271749.1 protein takeout-like [Macrosteles quadrilineatus]
MRALVVAVLVAVVAPALPAPAKLPHYMKPCRKNDPKLNECALKHGKEALPFIIQGDPKYGIPKLDPLVIDRIVVGDSKRQGSGGLGLVFTCEKCKFHGLKGVQAKAVRVDLKKQHIELEGSVPKLDIKGKYTAKGRVLVLPIEGAGDADLTLRNLSIVYRTDYDLKKGKDGKDHARVKNPKIDFKAGGFHIKLTNLFKGDENLGNNMNNFLNENWREVMAEFGPAVVEAVSRIVTLVVNNIAEKVAYDDILIK